MQPGSTNSETKISCPDFLTKMDHFDPMKSWDKNPCGCWTAKRFFNRALQNAGEFQWGEISAS